MAVTRATEGTNVKRRQTAFEAKLIDSLHL
jgi:hypothetical protein